MKVTREQIESLVERISDVSYDYGYEDGQGYPSSINQALVTGWKLRDLKDGLEFLLDLLFYPPAEIVQQCVGSKQAEIQAQCLSNAGVKACYMCGLPTSECDRLAQESGFDECEWLAGK